MYAVWGLEVTWSQEFQELGVLEKGECLDDGGVRKNGESTSGKQEVGESRSPDHQGVGRIEVG